jgi:hypothetical protein
MIDPCRDDNIVRYAGVPHAHWERFSHLTSGGKRCIKVLKFAINPHSKVSIFVWDDS